MAASLTFKAVGASLDDLAKRCRAMPSRAPETIAFANSGVIQQAGVVVREKYVVPGSYMNTSKNGYANYTAPPGATHGGIKRKKEVFVKGKFVSRSGELAAVASDIASTPPSTKYPNQISSGMNPVKGKDGEIIAEIDSHGRGVVTLTGGYRAAEVGKRGTRSNGVKGFWRGLRAASGRWSTLIKKKYPELLSLKGAR